MMTPGPDNQTCVPIKCNEDQIVLEDGTCETCEEYNRP